MLSVQGTGRSKRIAIRRSNGVVEAVPDLLCARKHVINDRGWKQVSSVKNLFTFVSSPQIYRQKKLVKMVKGWCHVFRRPNKSLPESVPKILLPESDFMDPMFVPCDPLNSKKKYDYFYFTINSKAGIDHKGLKVFIESLPVFSKLKLRGIVLVYFPNSGRFKRFVVRLSPNHQNLVFSHKKYVTYKWGILRPSVMNEVMQSCRFGFFPNTVDNSPRLISECLLRNIPILINRKIHGGWHYVSKDTGCEFDLSNLEEKIENIKNGDFHPRDYFMKNHGFEKSSQKLSNFLRELFGIDSTHAYFRDYSKYLEKINY